MRCPICHRRISVACPVHGGASAPDRGIAPAWPGVETLVPIALLGAGGGGAVWGASDGTARVAVKIAALGMDERLLRERDALARLGAPSTPSLIRETRAADGRLALVIEWLAGESLASALAALPSEGRYSLAMVAKLAHALAARIDAIHEAGIVHRDLKPENVWLEHDGNVRLLDFGLAGIADAPATATLAGTSTGTSHYMAPEQILGERTGRAADLYAFGAILVELITGRPPFVGGDARVGHISQRPLLPSELVPEAAHLDVIVARCLAKVPGHRPTSAREVAAAIDATPAARVAPQATIAGTQRARSAAAIAATAEMVQLRPVAVARRTRGATTTCEVVLAGITGSHRLDAIAHAAQELGGCVARVAAPYVVVAFPGVAATRGRELASDLVSRLALPAVIRTAELRLRAGARSTLSGTALDDLAWCVDPAVVVAAPARRPVVAAPAVVAASPLVGRNALADELAGQVTRALATATPIVITITGEPGIGTTRMLREVTDRVTAAIHYIAAGDDVAALLAAKLDVRANLPRTTRLEAIAHALAQCAAPTIIAIDDGHRCDIDLLDALERAAAAPRAPLAIVMAAHSGLYDLRPLWAEHAAIARRVSLAPLADAEVDALLRALLHPIEYFAEPVLARLRELVHGMPSNAIEIARQLRDAGAIRQFPDGGGWYLAHDELAPTRFATELAQRTLASQPRELMRVAQLAALLGDDVTPARIDALRSGTDQLDAGVALARLATLGVLAEARDTWRVRHELLRDALEATLPPSERAALHRIAAQLFAGSTTPAALAARARHALRAGDRETAASAQFQLAELARIEHRDVDADRAYTAALAHDLPAAARAQALLGRGKVRYRLHRLAEAADDLAAARPLLDEHAGLVTRIDVRLEQATVADWRERFDDSRAFADEAAALPAANDDLIEARLAMARGRSAFRQGRLADAHTLLANAAQLGDRETSTIASMLLGTSLVWAGDLVAARRVLDDVIAACEAAADRLHLCSALNDRMWLWFKTDDVDRAIDDQRRATELARQLGHAHLERCTTYNLAELLYWRGNVAEALPLALRSRSLQDRFVGKSPLDALLLARIHATHDNATAARDALTWIDATCDALTGATAMQRTLVELALSQRFDAAAWQAVLAAARETTVLYELAEALWFATRAALAANRLDLAHTWITEGHASVAARDTTWHVRFSAFSIERENHVAA